MLKAVMYVERRRSDNYVFLLITFSKFCEIRFDKKSYIIKIFYNVLLWCKFMYNYGVRFFIEK